MISINYYNEIKNEFINNEITRKVKDYSKNKSDLKTYYNVGKLLAAAGKKYGQGIIKEYSQKLTSELHIKYTKSSLYNMQKFYYFTEKTKFQTLSGKLSWSHYCELLSIQDIKKIEYYIKISETQNLSVRELRTRIKNNDYERLPHNKDSSTISNTYPINEFIKAPIIINNPYSIEVLKEKTLQKLILEDIPSFLSELGPNFSFLKNEYKIKIGDNYNYIDLLLYNIEFNCYVVIELKTSELRREHIGQIQVYMNYIDHNLKTISQNKTIGIILCRKDNKYIIKYCSDNRIIAREYELV